MTTPTKDHVELRSGAYADSVTLLQVSRVPSFRTYTRSSTMRPSCCARSSSRSSGLTARSSGVNNTEPCRPTTSVAA